MNIQEQTHNKLYDNLNDVSKIALQNLDPMHVLASGLDYFLTQTYVSAPNVLAAETLINASVERAKEENNG